MLGADVSGPLAGPAQQSKIQVTFWDMNMMWIHSSGCGCVQAPSVGHQRLFQKGEDRDLKMTRKGRTRVQEEDLPAKWCHVVFPKCQP